MSPKRAKPPGVPVLLCATRAEAAPLLGRLKLTNQMPGTDLYLIWGRLDGNEPVVVGVSGMGGNRAGTMTRYVTSNMDPSYIIWFGVAGGLKPGFEIGDLVIPADVSKFPSGEVFSPTLDLREKMIALARRHGTRTARGALIEMDRVVSSVQEKAFLGESTGASACDMESASFAEVAAPSGHRWAVIRSIFDRVDDELPEIPDDLLDDTGAVRPLKAASAFFRQPRALLELGTRNRTALARLGPLLPEVVRMLSAPQT